MKKNLITIVLTAAALLSILSLTFHLHQISKGKVLSQFNEKQIIIARQAARQIEAFFRLRSDDLRWLSSVVSLQYPDREKMAADIQSHFERWKSDHVSEVSLLDEKGTAAYSTTVVAMGVIHSQADFFSWARDPVNKGLVWVGYEKAEGRRIPISAGSPTPPPRIFLVTPLYREPVAGSRQKSGGKFAGALLFTVDLEKMLAEREVLVTPEMKLYSLWIMDRDGRVLLQSDHPEMVMRNFRERDETCTQCHPSFAFIETMLGRAEGVTEYQLKGYQRKIAAFASTSFENASWVIVVNAPLDEVTAFADTHFKQTIIILGITIFVLGLAFYIAYRNYRRRVDGEMELQRLSDQQKHMEALQESEERFRNLLNQSGDGIFLVDPATSRFLDVNETACELLGYSREELLQRGVMDIQTALRDGLVWQAHVKQLQACGRMLLEFETRPKDAAPIPVEVNIRYLVFAETPYIVAVVRDITERKKAGEELRLSEAKYRSLAERISELIYRAEPETLVATYVNTAVERIYGYTVDEWLRDPGLWEHTIYPNDRERVLAVFKEAQKDARDGMVEYRIIRKDGGLRWVIDRFAWERDPDGKVVSLNGVMSDITQRKRAEEELQQTLVSLRRAVGTTIQVLVSAVETRDPYTSGHQTRSADLARAIAAEMGLPKEKIEGIRMAGSIHDIGKLSVPAEILSKPTKLSDIELSLIKEHSRKGYEILKDVESPWPLAEIVYQHHERMDGSGYPRNLKGEEILIEARILAVADVVESMASHRPYRAALGMDVAVEEIEKNKGILYDQDVAEACLRLIREKGFRLDSV